LVTCQVSEVEDFVVLQAERVADAIGGDWTVDGAIHHKNRVIAEATTTVPARSACWRPVWPYRLNRERANRMNTIYEDTESILVERIGDALLLETDRVACVRVCFGEEATGEPFALPGEDCDGVITEQYVIVTKHCRKHLTYCYRQRIFVTRCVSSALVLFVGII